MESRISATRQTLNFPGSAASAPSTDRFCDTHPVRFCDSSCANDVQHSLGRCSDLVFLDLPGNLTDATKTDEAQNNRALRDLLGDAG